MSGPKLSQAEIERRRQEQLERERLAALKRLQDAQSAYRMECSGVRSLKDSTLSVLSQIDVVYRSDIETKVNSIISNLHIAQVEDKKSPESYFAAINEMAKKIEIISAELDYVMSKAIDRTANDKKLSDTNVSYQSFQMAAGAIGQEISVIKMDFNNSYNEDVVKKQLTAMIRHFSLLIHRADAKDIGVFSKKVVKKLRGMLSAGITLDNLEATRVMMQQIINEEQELIRLWKERQAMYDSYLALTTMTDGNPKEPEDFDSADSLRSEITRLKNLYRKQDEMDYIADQINDAMVDLGYTFVTSRVLTKKDRGETDFSLYKADEQTGVAVYTDQTGAVMMRMTVLGDDPKITEADREFSYQRQIDFCAGHLDLITALAKRGVFLKQKSYQEPDRIHTYKIDMRGQSVSANMGAAKKGSGVQKIDRRRRRRAGNKKMRTM